MEDVNIIEEEEIFKQLKMDSSEAHSALPDCIFDYMLLTYIIKVCGVGVNKLIELTRQPILLEVMAFGKHKGKHFKDIPKDYLVYMLKLKDLDRNLRFTMKKYSGV